MKKKVTMKKLWEILKNSVKGFSNDNVTTLSSSLAYYMVFSLAPLFIIIISLSSIFLGQDAAEGKVRDTLAGFVGSDTATQLQEIIQHASLSGKSHIAAIIGVITLIIGATTVFAQIQTSINLIWGLKPKPKRSWLKFLQNRFLSFSIIIALGFLLLVSLGVSSLIDAFSNSLKVHFPHVTVVIFYIVNLVITLIVTSLIFGAIFKVLPDAKIKWKDVAVGAIATAVLFMLAKFGISYYIRQSQVGSTYGAAGSLVILLLWVYFSAMILYFGAEFTKAYAMEYGSDIYPDNYAVTTKIIEVETGNRAIQDKKNVDIETKDNDKIKN